MLRRAFALFLFCAVLCPLSGFAATYYIDFVGGNNANNGTSTSTPWKVQPFMRGWNGSYTHAPGDRFIFKGGVTWPNGCFTMNLGSAPGRGGNASNYDYYGVDKTWYTGGSWTHPHFDAQGADLNGNGFNVMVTTSQAHTASYVIFDNIDFTGLYWAGTKSPNTVTYLSIGSSTYITIQNCKFRNWSHGTTSDDYLFCITGTPQPPYMLGCVAQDCEFDGETVANSTNGQSSGGGFYQWGGRILRCTFKNMINAILLGQGNTANTPVEVAYCDIGPIKSSFTNAHDNGIEENLGASLVYIHDNYIHDCRAVTVLVGGNGGERDFIWNNVFYNNAAKDLDLDTRNFSTPAYVWNNTFIGNNTHIGIGNSSGIARPLSVLVNKNNHFIGGTMKAITTPGVTITTLIESNNSTATSGFSALGVPTSGAADTVNAGTATLSLGSGAPNSADYAKDIFGVTRGGTLDIGAYEWNGAAPANQAPVVSIISPSGPATITEGGSLTFTGSASDPNGDTLTYAWDFDDSGISASTSLSPGAKTFATAGNYTISFTATDPSGLFSTASVQIVVNPAPSNPQISVTGSGDFGYVNVDGTSNLVLSVSNAGNGTLTGSATVSAPFSVVSGGSYSLTIGQSQNVFIRYSPTVASDQDSDLLAFTGGGDYQKALVGRTPHDLVFDASVGVIAAPFTVAVNREYISQATETLTPSSGGLAYYEFFVEEAGDYTITASVDVVSTSADSFFINVDAEPTTPTMIWDVQTLTDGFENRAVSWRGNGTFDNPQFDPKTWALSAGKHKLYVRGREANAKLASITFELQSVEEPDPVITLSPASLSFGTVSVGQTRDLIINVKNNGGGTLTGAATVPASVFTILSGGSYSLASGASQDVYIRYTPTAYGTLSSQDVTFTGTGISSTTAGVTGTSAAATAPMGVIDSPTGNVSIVQGGSVTFAATASDGAGHTPITHFWDFPVGSGITDSTLEDPGAKTFNNVGVFPITYTATNSLSVADPTPATITVTVTAASGAPVPKIIFVR